MYCDRLTGQVMVSSRAPVAETNRGKVAGIRKNGTYIFRGIPYAKARRFHLPEGMDRWDGILSAAAYGYVCPEPVTRVPGDGFLNPHYYMPQDENCQYLNIWTQSLEQDAKKPVMVWMHGGAWVSGSSVEQFAYDGEELSKFGDVVVVSFNHRLHVLGGLDLSAFGEEYAESSCAGLADIIMCLKWVRDNIASFGGDPDNVLVFGQSGGVAKIYALMQCPQADGLYHKAACSSGGLREQVLPEGWTKRALAQKMAELVVQELGIGERKDIRRIETVPFWELADAAIHAEERLRKECHMNAPYRWEPVEDGVYVKQSTLRNGFRTETAKIPFLIGNVLGEQKSNAVDGNLPKGRLKDVPKSEWTEAEIKDLCEDRWGKNSEEVYEEFNRVYPDHDRADVLFADHEERCGQLAIARMRAAMGSDVWNWLFTKDSPVNGGMTAWHCADIPYVFHNTAYIESAWDPGRSENLEKIMCTSWVNFARNGNPNGGCVPAWHRLTGSKTYTMIFDTVCGERLDHDQVLCRLFGGDEGRPASC